MVRIRLRRMGAKKKPTYRIVVANQQNARDGRFIEIVGTYDPHAQQTNVPNSGVKLENERIAHWLAVGAQPSDSVARLLRNAGLLDGNNRPVPLEDVQESTGLTADAATGAVPEAVDTDQTATESSDEAAVAA